MSVQRSHTTLAIGLTGGIGSGKTAVSNLFQQLGANVIDADEIARALVSKGTPLLEDIRQHFGDDILDPEGNLNRRALRETVFNDTTARQWLESLLHPAVRQTIIEQLQHSTAPYTLVVIPLLVESGSYPFLDRIAVVDIPESLQVERTVSRDNSSAELVEKILASQASRQTRLAQADDVIDNSGTPDALMRQVNALHERYLQLAGTNA